MRVRGESLRSRRQRGCYPRVQPVCEGVAPTREVADECAEAGDAKSL